MSIVAFWGFQHGLGVTSNTAAIASAVAQDYRLRTLVMQPQYRDQTLEWAFRSSIRRHNAYAEDTFHTGYGMDGLERAVRSSKLERDSIKNNTLVVDPDRLDLLQGSNKASLEQFEETQDVFEIVLKRAKEYYDVVLLDLHSGCNSKITHTAADAAELIIVCVDQNINVLNKFFKERESWPYFLQTKPFILMIGKYDADSKYRAKNIAASYGYKKPILTVPYSAGFKDHYNDGDLRSFFTKNINADRYSPNLFFVKEVRAAAKLILNEIGVNTQVKHINAIEKGAS